MKRVLVIDDDAAVLSLTSKALQARGFQTLTAGDGMEGLDLARIYLPDLIICDVQMPRLNGYETLAALQQDALTATIPFIFLTGLAEQWQVRYGMGLGADDYLTKPFTLSELMAAVTTRLAKKAAADRASDRKLEDLRGSIGKALPHELLTPLNGILGLSDLLANSPELPDPADLRDFAKGIQVSALRLHHLISNFIMYSELELIASDPERIVGLPSATPTLTRDLVVKAAREKAEAAARDADLALEVEEGLVTMAIERCRKIVEELVENAFKFSKTGTPVQVLGQNQERHYVLTIRDRGRGMTPDQISSVGAHMQFERRFYEQQGAGLGLIIARRLAELHGGGLRIDSIPGQETTVEVRLPRGLPPAKPEGRP
jgi:two-component system sensor histidine kinase/response regulator